MVCTTRKWKQYIGNVARMLRLKKIPRVHYVKKGGITSLMYAPPYKVIADCLLYSHNFLLLCSEEFLHFLHELVVNLLELVLSVLLKVF